MSRSLRIDRIVLEGIELTSRERAQLESALTHELEHLLRDANVQSELAQGRSLSKISTEPLSMPSTGNPTQLGQGIAQRLGQALTVPTPRGNRS